MTQRAGTRTPYPREHPRTAPPRGRSTPTRTATEEHWSPPGPGAPRDRCSGTRSPPIPGPPDPPGCDPSGHTAFRPRRGGSAARFPAAGTHPPSTHSSAMQGTSARRVRHGFFILHPSFPFPQHTAKGQACQTRMQKKQPTAPQDALCGAVGLYEICFGRADQ